MSTRSKTNVTIAGIAVIFVLGVIALIFLLSQPSKKEFADEEYVELAREFAQLIMDDDFEKAWTMTAPIITLKYDEITIEKTCHTYFNMIGKPNQLNSVSLAAKGDQVGAMLNEFESFVEAEDAIAICVGDYSAEVSALGIESSLSIGVVLVQEGDELKVGDFWLFEPE